MIDLHCHILPGVDDGSPSPEASCRMARLAAESGVTAIVATPHCNLPQGPSNYRSTLLLEKLQALNLLFSRSGIPITVYPGAEVLARENLLSLLRDGKLMTLNNSRYLLTEFFFGE